MINRWIEGKRERKRGEKIDRCTIDRQREIEKKFAIDRQKKNVIREKYKRIEKEKLFREESRQERWGQWGFIILVSKINNIVFLFVGLKTLGTLLNFDLLIH